MPNAIQHEIDANFDRFQRSLSDFLPQHSGEFALLRHGEVVDFYRSALDAEGAGENQYPDGVYSIQEVTDAPVDLGFFSHAFDNRTAQ